MRLNALRLQKAAIAGATLWAALAAALAGTGAAAPATVHLRGTAYDFNNVHVLLGGATIRVAEYPRLRAVVRRDGTYDLAVPDRASVTPYIVAPGYHTIYLQTFATDGEDLQNVNFQTPTQAIYHGLAALLKVPVDSHGNPIACAIVSTFSTRNVRDLGYSAFIAYGAHGVAGATASATPPLPKAVYFNESVVPDPAQKTSSKDGGVVWTGVPSGVYRITAHDRATRFASFLATCRPGRVINANPPWGLYQLSPPNPARVSASWSVSGRSTRILSMRVRALPPSATVRVGCSGAGCPFTSRTLRPNASALDLRRALGAVQLRAGDSFAVTVRAHAFNGALVRWRIVNGRAPQRTSLCIPFGYLTPRRHCPTGL